MSIKKYQTFTRVVELRSITKAAASLGVTQSSVTQLLTTLEKDMGVKLLDRNRQGIELTREGAELYPLIKDIMKAESALEDKLDSIRSRSGDVIRIGAFTSVAVNWLPNIIKEYRKLRPDTKFELVDCGYNNIEVTLSESKVDFGFVPMPVGGAFKCAPLYKDRLLAVLPTDHPASSGKSCPITLFKTEPVISLIDTIDKDARTVFRHNGITPNTKYTVEDDFAMLAMVEQGLGICIVPELMLLGMKAKVTTLELDPPAYRTIGIAYPAGKKVSEEARDFASFVESWVNRVYSEANP